MAEVFDKVPELAGIPGALKKVEIDNIALDAVSRYEIEVTLPGGRGQIKIPLPTAEEDGSRRVSEEDFERLSPAELLARVDKDTTSYFWEKPLNPKIMEKFLGMRPPEELENPRLTVTYRADHGYYEVLAWIGEFSHEYSDVQVEIKIDARTGDIQSVRCSEPGSLSLRRSDFGYPDTPHNRQFPRPGRRDLLPLRGDEFVPEDQRRKNEGIFGRIYHSIVNSYFFTN